MNNPFVRKLEHGAMLTEADREILRAVSSVTRPLHARQDVIGEGQPPSNVHLVTEGLACRYKLLPDGKRQIVALFVPGDICDLHVQILGRMDHSIGTLTACRLAELSPAIIDRLTANPRINRALWWATLVDEATLREWLVNMGQRSADRQLAHLLCELLMRYRLVGMAKYFSFILQITQEELADTTGVTAVHVNRTMRALRESRLNAIEGERIFVLDMASLAQFCDFDANYLHLGDNHANWGGGAEAGQSAATSLSGLSGNGLRQTSFNAM